MTDDHTASRRVDVLRRDAPHLLASEHSAASHVRKQAETLRMTIETMRRTIAAGRTIEPELWELADRLTRELAEELGTLEREQAGGGAA